MTPTSPQPDDRELQPLSLEKLFEARKTLTDNITRTAASYTYYSTVVRDTTEQIDKLDALIRDLTHPPKSTKEGE